MRQTCDSTRPNHLSLGLSGRGEVVVIGLCVSRKFHLHAPFLLATSGGKSIPDCQNELDGRTRQARDRPVLAGLDKLAMVTGKPLPTRAPDKAARSVAPQRREASALTPLIPARRFPRFMDCHLVLITTD